MGSEPGFASKSRTECCWMKCVVVPATIQTTICACTLGLGEMKAWNGSRFAGQADWRKNSRDCMWTESVICKRARARRSTKLHIDILLAINGEDSYGVAMAVSHGR